MGRFQPVVAGNTANSSQVSNSNSISAAAITVVGNTGWSDGWDLTILINAPHYSHR
jgi:hypothetical protein